MPFEKKKKVVDDVKRKKTIAYTTQDICENLFEIIRNQKMEDGSLLCEAFIRMPKRREDPDYYAIVTSPIDLTVMGSRVKDGEYADVKEMEADFNLIISNALSFYPQNSKEALQAKELASLFVESKRELMAQAAEAICSIADEHQQNEEKDQFDNTKNFQEESSITINEKKEENVETEIKLCCQQPSTILSPPPPLVANNHFSPIKPKTEGVVDESSRSAFSTITSGSEMDDESKVNKNVGDVSEVKKKKKGRRTNKEIQRARMLEMASEESNNVSTSEQTTEEDDGNMIEQLFSTTVVSAEGLQSFTEFFKIVPSKTKCPIYHQVVKDPMDLRSIARKIQGGEYATVDDLIKDFMLIVTNAKSYNEPHTRTYKEANFMKKHLLNKKQELEQRKQMRSQRTRIRNQFQAIGNMSSVFAALKSESEDERMGSDGEFSESGHGNEQWALFNAVKSYTDASDAILSEPFLRLPSKRFYPDYFQEIKRPMSLMKIQKKIKSGSYVSLDMLTRDMELVFENAMQYNREDSRIYKDAESLLQVMRKKVEEIVKEKSLNESLEEDKRKRPRLTDESLKKNLYNLYRTVLEHKVDDRNLIDIFMRLPSKLEYPDYYDIITRPIDMSTIEYKIKNDRYHEMQSLVDDLKLMFKNARLYNKELSQVFNDAMTLERLVNHTYHNYLQQLQNSNKNNYHANNQCKKVLNIDNKQPSLELNTAFNRVRLQKQQELYHMVCNYKDSCGRVLSTPFINLPLKSEYPDYYETISKPMDLTRVYQRIVSNGYPLLDDIFNDLSLIFTNACLYNEPDSLIYKDAVSLQRVCNERKALWNDQAATEVPNIDSLVQGLLNHLLNTLCNHHDSNGRFYINSFHELNLDYASPSFQKKPRKSLDYIQREVEMSCYKRLDSLQENLVAFFEHVIINYKHNKQLIEDSVELLKTLIAKRDHLCGGASPLELQSLSSPAFNYDFNKLQKFLKENCVVLDDEDKKENDVDDEGNANTTESIENGGQTYFVGDFVYINNGSKIMEIIKIWRTDDLSAWRLKGRVFMPPQATKHHVRRTFLHKEVLMLDQLESFTADVIISRCLVLPVESYALYQATSGDQIAEKDVFVCESKYDPQTHFFRVIKHWNSRNKVTLGKKETPSILARFPLNTKHAPLPMPPSSVVDKQRVIVQLVNVNPNDSNIYFEQICTSNNLWIKIGDFIVTKVNTVGERGKVVRVEKIWNTNRGESNISGPILLQASEVSHHGNRTFYRKELLLGNKEAILNIASISHTCSVLSVIDYCTRRIVGCNEDWVFVCDVRYNEADKTFRKAVLSIKQSGLSDQVCLDEIISLKKPIVVAREQTETVPASSGNTVIMEEESMDFFPSTETSSNHDSTSFISESFSGGNIAIANSNINTNGVSSGNNGIGNNDPASSVKKKRKRTSTSKVRNVTGYIVYAGECRKNIQAEFPDLNFGDISRAVGTRWKSLPKDLKEKYEERARQLTQEGSRDALASPVAPDSRSMSPATLVSTIHSKTQQQQLQNPPTILPTIDLSANQNNVTKFNHGPPVFVDVPPQTYKVVHSEAYIRYIHGLAKGNRLIGDFNKTLWAKKPELTAVETVKLPSHWLANGPGHHGDVVSAFWALRQHMLNDALRIDRALN